MGRLQTIVLASAFAFVPVLQGCEDKAKPTPPSNKRSEAVLASGTTSAPHPTSHPTPSATARAPRTLCPGPSLNRPLPSEKLGHAEAQGTPALGDSLPVGDNRWTWINLWAAWCVPCKEEMPRLLEWQNKLSSKLRMVFLSLDDDERQLLKFLESQPPKGVRSSYWLPEGNSRENWLGGVHLKASPQLPVQILVNPAGRVHCIVEGAVEDTDFAQINTLTAAR